MKERLFHITLFTWSVRLKALLFWPIPSLKPHATLIKDNFFLGLNLRKNWTNYRLIFCYCFSFLPEKNPLNSSFHYHSILIIKLQIMFLFYTAGDKFNWWSQNRGKNVSLFPPIALKLSAYFSFLDWRAVWVFLVTLIFRSFFFFSFQSEPNIAAMNALIQKLHLCINQLEQVDGYFEK